MPVYFDKARRRWRYEFSRQLDGRRCRATKLLPAAWTHAQAHAYAAEQDRKLYATATGATRPRHLISEAVRLYLTEHAPSLKAAVSIERELALCAHAYLGRHMSELPEAARAYAIEQAGTLQPSTIKRRIAYLRAACRWAWKHHGLGDQDPASRLTLPKVRDERHVYIGRADMLRLARAMPSRATRAFVLVAFYSGMRLAEIARAVATDHGWLLADTKNGERRLVPIHPKVAHLARHWPPGCRPGLVQAHFLRTARAHGHPGLRFHDLRHSAASALVNAGVDLYAVGAILGHKAPASTKRYAHLASDTLAAALSKIGRRA
jgi:integrase